MQTLEELKAQVRELQKDKERYMAEKCSSELKETSDKACINCQNKFPVGISSCQLYFSSPTYRLVGKGKVHNTLGDLLHHRPLPAGHLKVLVGIALDLDVLLPIPDIVSKTTLLRDAIGSFVAWSSDLIFIDDETPTKLAFKDKGILRHNESVTSQKESQQVSQKTNSVPNKKRDLPRSVARKAFVPRFRMCLETLVGTSNLMNGAIHQMDMEEGIFAFYCSETISKEEMEHIFQHTKLGIGVVHLYIRFLYEKLMRENQLSNKFHFVSSARVNGASFVKDPDSVRYHLVERYKASSTESLYLLPYNTIPRLWLLVAIDPFKEVVYYLNSVDGDWTTYL
ncbi:uncharacterized protein LOC131597238 [Vicia villosa]|uniref:uncharacterized protein LOC131597238 n=1 Tax=Vicia villosa TaxID=3911 RepID=UPI00273C78D5|nr:uncharacterized protein LOC131597238 [Vicia villosa]